MKQEQKMSEFMDYLQTGKVKAKTLKQQQDEWFEINSPLGKELGYPECCVKEFCAQPPELLKKGNPSKSDIMRYKAGCVNGVFSGFIPCAFHARQVVSKKITLHSLITNRNKDFPLFPLFGSQYE